MLVPVKEIAKRLGVHSQTVYRWIYNGKLEARKIDGIIRVDEEAYYRFVSTKFRPKKKRKKNV